MARWASSASHAAPVAFSVGLREIHVKTKGIIAEKKINVTGCWKLEVIPRIIHIFFMIQRCQLPWCVSRVPDPDGRSKENPACIDAQIGNQIYGDFTNTNPWPGQTSSLLCTIVVIDDDDDDD